MNNYRRVLEEGLSLAGSGDLEAALLKLHEGLEQANKAKEQKWSALLARNAGLLHLRKGELNEARKLFEVSLANDPANPATRYALGEVCERIGDMAAAENHYRSCYELSKSSGDKEMLELLEKRRRT
ncbi:MAG TPA: tetratricopeptide repeat protein [Pyrinomonadaceae bacterium]|nr:tetratricopeptide repeat protein [Pyrinomonadaceae bacterium]